MRSFRLNYHYLATLAFSFHDEKYPSLRTGGICIVGEMDIAILHS